MKNLKNLILIPAFDETKNVSRQNLRIVNNKPLIYHILKTCQDSNSADVYVITDSEEIKEVSLQYNTNVIELSKSNITPKFLVEYSLKLLIKKGLHYKKCVMITPSLPLIKSATLKKFFSKIKPNFLIIGYTERSQTYKKLNSKSNIPKLSEVSDVVTIRNIMGFDSKNFLKNNKFSQQYVGIRLSTEESITVKNYHDLNQIEKILSRKKILVRVDGSKKIGLGHVYNMLTLLNYLRNDEILIVMNKNKNLGSEKFRQQFYNLRFYLNDSDLFKIINDFKPDIMINDILNTSKQYMKKLRKPHSFIVNFEDLGTGSDLADLVFNPIYQSNENKPRQFFGSNYACVRDEFRILQSNPIKKKVENILVTFGGTDPQNLTLPVLKLISKINIKEKVVIILGMGNSKKQDIKNFVKKMNQNGQDIKIIEQSNIMAKYIRESDFVITANGRTVFEIASLKVPMITISVHEREELHKFSRLSGGAIHLGSINDLTMKSFQLAISKIFDYDFRLKLRLNLEKYDLLNGVHEIIKIINTKLEENKI